MLKTPTVNTLFYGDNLAILREHIEDESVDLVYLDPPFNSNANYNLLFKAPDGIRARRRSRLLATAGIGTSRPSRLSTR
jgi:16S rRNA G966 N2-methylase RsmD